MAEYKWQQNNTYRIIMDGIVSGNESSNGAIEEDSNGGTGNGGKYTGFSGDFNKSGNESFNIIKTGGECQNPQQYSNPSIGMWKNVHSEKNPYEYKGFKAFDKNSKNWKYLIEDGIFELLADEFTSYPYAVRVIALAQAYHEGYYPKSKAYRTKNPGNIGNTDSGATKDFKKNSTKRKIYGGIEAQLQYITGKYNQANPQIGKYYKRTPHSNGKTCANGFEFTYYGEIYKYLWIYATGPRHSDSYLKDVLWHLNYHGITAEYNSKIPDLAKKYPNPPSK